MKKSTKINIRNVRVPAATAIDKISGCLTAVTSLRREKIV